MLIERTHPRTGEVFKFTPEQHQEECLRILKEWEEAKQALAFATAREMDLRKEYVAIASDPAKESGTENIALGGDMVAKIVKKVNYGWVKKGDKADYDALENVLDKIEKTVPAGELIAERLVKWTAELSLTEYKLLPPQAKVLIDTVIVKTEGAPSLSIAEQKRK